jgi:flagellar FliL protein
MMFGNKSGDAHAEKKDGLRKTPVFVDLEMFTVNLRDSDNERFLQVKLVAEMKDAASGELLKTMMPAVRNEILLLLSSKQAADVASREGKEKLAKEIVVAANKPLESTAGAKAVEGVNFTHLIVQ